MHSMHQALRSPARRSYGEDVAAACAFKTLFSDSAVQAGWGRFGGRLWAFRRDPVNAERLHRGGTVRHELDPSVLSALLGPERGPDRCLWQAVPEAGAYDESPLVFTRRYDRGGLWRGYVIPASTSLKARR